MDSANKFDDIELLISEIEHIKININDPLLGSVFWEESMKSFIEKHGSTLITLLRELEQHREKE